MTFLVGVGVAFFVGVGVTGFFVGTFVGALVGALVGAFDGTLVGALVGVGVAVGIVIMSSSLISERNRAELLPSSPSTFLKVAILTQYVSPGINSFPYCFSAIS